MAHCWASTSEYTDHYPFAVLGLLGHVAAVLVIYYALSKFVGNDRALFAGTVLERFRSAMRLFCGAPPLAMYCALPFSGRQS